jgi:hypothetical protein
MIIEKKVADENKKGKRGWWEHKNGNCQNIIYLMMTVFVEYIVKNIQSLICSFWQS